MASVFKHIPSTPKQAARRKAKLDGLLDPEVFKVLGEPTRAKLLGCLIKCSRPCSVTEVAECCSLDFSMVARHLAALARAGVLEAEKQGRTVWYSARSEQLVQQFRELADSIEQWRESAAQQGGCCDADEGCGCC